MDASLSPMSREGASSSQAYMEFPSGILELQAPQEAQAKFQGLGASLVAISPQNQANSRKSARQNNVAFPILSDRNNDVATQFGITFALPAYLVHLYKKIGYDLPAYGSDKGWILPMPLSYVISRAGRIIYADVNPDFTHRPEPEGVLPTSRRNSSSGKPALA